MKNKKGKGLAEPQYINSPLNNPMMNYKTYVVSKSEKLITFLLFFVVGGFVGLIFYGGLFKVDGFATTSTYISDCVLFFIVGILSSKFLSPMYVKRKLNKQKNIIKNQFKDMLECLSSSLSSGSNVTNAFSAALADLKMQYNEKEYIVLEMQEIVNGISQNISVEKMLNDFGERTGNEDIMAFANVFDICYRKGGDMRSVVHKTHTVISEKIAISDEIETKLTSNKLQHNVMSLMPIAVVALLRFTNESFAANFATLTGVIANTVAIGIFVGAYLYGQKIVDVKG